MNTEKTIVLPDTLTGHVAVTGAPHETQTNFFLTGVMSEIQRFLKQLEENVDTKRHVASNPDVSSIAHWIETMDSLTVEGEENLFTQDEEGYKPVLSAYLRKNTTIIFGASST